MAFGFAKLLSIRGVTLLVAFISASASISLAQVAEPAETAETFAREQKAALAQLQNETPATPAKPIDALVTFDLVNGRLTMTLVDPSGPDELSFALPGEADSAFRLSVGRLATQPPTLLSRTHLMKFDAAASRATNIEIQPTPLNTNLTITVESLTGTTTVQMVEQIPPPGADASADPPSARIYYSRDATSGGNGEVKINLAAPTFGDVVQANHDNALAMLGEGLSAMRAMHLLAGVSQAEARAIFAADQVIDAPVDKQLDDLIAALDKGGSDVIPTLRAKLRDLGPAAAAALNARPRGSWSVDLALNVDTLTAGLLPGPEKRGTALLSSPGRLIDLLYSPDESIRRAVIERLAKRSVDHIDLDPAADPYSQSLKIETLRAKLDPPTQH